MRRKTILFICMMALAITISACKEKNNVERPVEEVVTEVETGNDEIVADEIVEEVNEADPSEEVAEEAVEEINESDVSNVIYKEYIYIGSLDCFQWEDENHLNIVFEKGQTFYLDSDTVINKSVPCNDDSCDAITWAHRYIEHCPITDDSDPNEPYYCLGFGGFDEWEVMIDENNNIKEIIEIFAAD